MMSSNIIEQTRSKHEEIERLEGLAVKELKTEPKSRRDRLVQGHGVRNVIESIMVNTKKLVEIYEDKDGSMEDEIARRIGDQTNLLYDRLREIGEYHRNHGSSSGCFVVDDFEADFKPVIAFSGEEGFGRYLDLHDFYNQYINFVDQKVEYSTYLDVFSQPDRKLKFSNQYRKYMDGLLEYLINFFKRTEPLQDLERMLSKVETDFEEQYALGKINGTNDDSVIDLDYYTTVEELIDLGAEKLKEALGSLGMKVGGTVKQRAERLFLTKHTPLEKLDKKHFARQSGAKKIALTEAKVKKLCILLDKTIKRTKENVEKKQSLTYKQMEEEREAEEEAPDAGLESDDDEEDGKVYNPRNFPMGVDGKPIPNWLYNLHGLGQEFKCEICGSNTYKGRRAFEKHFKEPQHQQGMNCLGIPNSKCFNEITSIDDAKLLWKRIQERQGANKWRPELQEEYEDRQGNIYNMKTYSDLLRQGLI